MRRWCGASAPKSTRADGDHVLANHTFASAHAIYGLSKLSVWWLRLGIQIERIKPGHPQQNGRHERMHLTLKKDATQPAAANVLQQQARFDTFVEQDNQERPHQALGTAGARRSGRSWSCRPPTGARSKTAMSPRMASIR
jgi:transposase InsO family protein